MLPVFNHLLSRSSALGPKTSFVLELGRIADRFISFLPLHTSYHTYIIPISTDHTSNYTRTLFVSAGSLRMSLSPVMGLPYMPISWGGARGVNGAAVLWQSYRECLGQFFGGAPSSPPGGSRIHLRFRALVDAGSSIEHLSVSSNDIGDEGVTPAVTRDACSVWWRET